MGHGSVQCSALQQLDSLPQSCGSMRPVAQIAIRFVGEPVQEINFTFDIFKDYADY